jgi:uncharacterized Zn finger protein (UPF0148 family)
MTTTAIRCANCGAPLEDTAGATVLRCPYCLTENRLERCGPSVERVQLAAAEADALAKENEAKGEELRERFMSLAERAREGDEEAAEGALAAMEGYLRLQYAPTIHIYQSWDPNDPRVVQAMEQIDQAIAQALASLAASLGIADAAGPKRE